MNFWEEMKNSGKPILCLAPMADVTDVAFRHIIAKYSKITSQNLRQQGAPLRYVTYTEFVSADGIVLAPERGRVKLMKDLEYSEIERPIVAQFFTSKPEMMEKAAALAVELGFDGVDINMGCPDKSIEKQGAGAALIKTPKLAREIIRAAKHGAQNKIPVSVKTRLGYNRDELDPPVGGWLPELLKEEPAAIVIHARTRKEMSKVSARWERVKRAVEIRDEFESRKAQGASTTLILGNGDVANVEHAYKLVEETGADGAMLGRAVFGNPFLFSDHVPSAEEKLNVLVEHTKLFEEKLGPPAGGIKSFAIMKKHFKSYLLGIPNASELRQNLMQTENAEAVEKLVNEFLMSYYL